MPASRCSLIIDVTLCTAKRPVRPLSFLPFTMSSHRVLPSAVLLLLLTSPTASSRGLLSNALCFDTLASLQAAVGAPPNSAGVVDISVCAGCVRAELR